MKRAAPYTLLALVIFSLQLAGGAYRAEFTYYPDEPGQFLSGLMLFDYLKEWPPGNPLDWGLHYYLHYPRIGLGRWPPGFSMAEAIWWLLFGPSRASAIALLGLTVWTSAAVLFRLASRMVPAGFAFCAVLLSVIAPVTAASYSSVMADALCLLTSVLLIDATVRQLECPSPANAFWIVCILAGGLLVKGTALCLLPVPLLALGCAGKLGRIWLWLTPVSLLYFAIPARYLSLARQWSGASLVQPWRVSLTFHLMGYAVAIFALGGLYFAARRRDPPALVAAAAALSTVAVSFFLRAMNETRHWIVIVPALVLLSLECFRAVPLPFKRKLAIAGLAVLATFPFHFLSQQPEGYSAFAATLQLPSRMLVSATGDGEGPWIAEIALHDHRPGSVVARATKVLAQEDWNGDSYRLLVHSPEEALRRLDELGIDTVVLIDQPVSRSPPHQALLAAALTSSRSWRLSESQGMFQSWKRIQPPSVPRQPLTIDLRGTLGRLISE
jgi:hypothetical protein